MRQEPRLPRTPTLVNTGAILPTGDEYNGVVLFLRGRGPVPAGEWSGMKDYGAPVAPPSKMGGRVSRQRRGVTLTSGPVGAGGSPKTRTEPGRSRPEQLGSVGQSE